MASSPRRHQPLPPSPWGADLAGGRKPCIHLDKTSNGSIKSKIARGGEQLKACSLPRSPRHPTAGHDRSGAKMVKRVKMVEMVKTQGYRASSATTSSRSSPPPCCSAAAALPPPPRAPGGGAAAPRGAVVQAAEGSAAGEVAPRGPGPLKDLQECHCVTAGSVTVSRDS